MFRWPATRQDTEVSFAVVNCRVKTLNCEDQRHGTTSEVHSEKLENIMVYQHYGTQTANRGADQPGMLVKHKDSTWTASANARGRLYLHRGVEMTYTRDLLVEVYLNGLGNGLSH
jgi:hypothetical protein